MQIGLEQKEASSLLYRHNIADGKQDVSVSIIGHMIKMAKLLKVFGNPGRLHRNGDVFVSFCRIFFFFNGLFIHLTERESTSRKGRGRGRCRRRLPTELGAQHRTPYQDPETRAWAQGRHPTIWATQVPPGCVEFQSVQECRLLRKWQKYNPSTWAIHRLIWKWDCQNAQEFSGRGIWG